VKDPQSFAEYASMTDDERREWRESLAENLRVVVKAAVEHARRCPSMKERPLYGGQGCIA